MKPAPFFIIENRWVYWLSSHERNCRCVHDGPSWQACRDVGKSCCLWWRPAGCHLCWDDQLFPALAMWPCGLTWPNLFLGLSAAWGPVTLHLKLLIFCSADPGWSVFLWIQSCSVSCLIVFLNFVWNTWCLIVFPPLTLLEGPPDSALKRIVCTKLICPVHTFPTWVLYPLPPLPVEISTSLQA